MTKSLQDLLENTKRNEESGCLEWQRYCMKNGYGTTCHNSKKRLAHRLAWCLANGVEIESLESTQFVLHSCDNRACINPEHLSLGTVQDNQRQMAERGRSLQGQKSHRAKLTRKQVLEIRRRYSSGLEVQADLAAEFGVSPDTISGITAGRMWKHLPGGEPGIGRQRRPRGMKHNAKIDEAQVESILADYATGGFTQAALGEKHNISQSAVGHILRQHAPHLSLGRGRKGLRRKRVITDEQMAEVARKYATGKYTQKELAEPFGLSPNRMSMLLKEHRESQK